MSVHIAVWVCYSMLWVFMAYCTLNSNSKYWFTHASRHRQNGIVSVGSTDGCLIGSLYSVSNFLHGLQWVNNNMCKVLLDTFIEIKSTLSLLYRQFCSVLLISHYFAVYTQNRFSVLHILITEQRRILYLSVLSTGKSLFTETLDAALGKLIDQ